MYRPCRVRGRRITQLPKTSYDGNIVQRNSSKSVLSLGGLPVSRFFSVFSVKPVYSFKNRKPVFTILIFLSIESAVYDTFRIL